VREFTARERSILAGVSAAGAAFVVFYALILAARPGDTYLSFHTNVMYNLPALFALAVAPIAIRRSRGRQRAGWACLVLTLVLWQTADWMYAWYAYALHAEVPFPGIPDIFYYAGYGGYAAAIPLLALPDRRLRDGRWMIDAAIVIIVAGALGWQFIMRPIVAAGDASAFSVAVAIGYPLLDLALLAALVVTFFAAGMRVSLHGAVLALATLTQVITDAVYTYTVNTGDYQAVGDPSDLGWVVGYALLAIAFAVPARTTAVKAERRSMVGALAPYAALAPLAAALLTGGARSELLIAATLTAFGLVALRQVVTLRENQALLSALEETSGQLERAIVVERESARRDTLTGTLNHGAISGELRTVIESDTPAPCAVIMLDIDGMKATNDMFGHQAGDRVLMDVSRAMDRDGAVVGRYGGDEFIALLPGASRADAETYRASVASAIAEIRATDPATGSRVPIEASIGLALFPEDAGDLAGLVARSDGAMYAEKRRRPVAANQMPQLRDERAARMIGELVTLLTSDTPLSDKTRFVVRALAVGAAYDFVALTLLQGSTTACVSFSHGAIQVERGAASTPALRRVERI
jgi:diguanylate cyclase (GGDEF)-like protein